MSATSNNLSFFGKVQDFVAHRNENVRKGLDKIEGYFDVARKNVYYLADKVETKIEEKIGKKAAHVFHESVRIAPFAAAIFAAYSFLSLPALLVMGLAFTAVAVLTKTELLTTAAKDLILKASIPAAVLATIVKVVSLLASGAGVLPIIGTLALGALVGGALYLLLNRNNPTQSPLEAGFQGFPCDADIHNDNQPQTPVSPLADFRHAVQTPGSPQYGY